jgi:hypothetical protein
LKRIWTPILTVLIFSLSVFFWKHSTDSHKKSSLLFYSNKSNAKSEMPDQNLVISKKISHKIQLLLTNEEHRIYNFQNLTFSENSRLKKIAELLTSDDLIQLKNSILNSEMTSDQRFIALHFLILTGVKSHDLICEIFFASHELLDQSFPAHSAQNSLKEVEINIRTLAIEQIEKNIFLTKNTNNPLHIHDLSLHSENEYLLSLLKIVQASERMNVPLLAQFIQTTLKENRNYE